MPHCLAATHTYVHLPLHFPLPPVRARTRTRPSAVRRVPRTLLTGHGRSRRLGVWRGCGMLRADHPPHPPHPHPLRVLFCAEPRPRWPEAHARSRRRALVDVQPTGLDHVDRRRPPPHSVPASIAIRIRSESLSPVVSLIVRGRAPSSASGRGRGCCQCDRRGEVLGARER